MAGIQGALETAVPLSRLHGRESYDVADFPVPNGREEEWRFTPLRRLHGLHGEGTASVRRGRLCGDWRTAAGQGHRGGGRRTGGAGGNGRPWAIRGSAARSCLLTG